MVMASDVPTLLVAMKMDKILSFQDSNLAAGSNVWQIVSRRISCLNSNNFTLAF